MDSVFTGYFMPTILAHVEYIQHIPIVLGIGMVLLLVLCIGSSSMFASTVITTPKYPAHCQLQMQQSENEKRSKSNSETRNNLINQDLDRKNNSNKSGERLRTKMAVLKRKRNFMNSAHGEHYGYASSSIGHIDTWREREFPSLIKPVSGHEPVYDSTSTTTRTSHDNEMEEESEVYLDHAGAGIPSKSLLDSMHAQSLKDQVLANPHSNGRAAARTKAAIENVKKQILDFFDANAGCRYGYTCEKEQDRAELEQDYHPGYDVIFTSGTTQALQIVAENFGWSHPGHHGETSDDDEKGRNKSTLLYSHNSHTSVIGMREPALGKGASFQCRQLDEISRATPEDFDRWANQDTTSYGDGEYAFAEHEESDRISEHEAPNHLLVFPLECNFGGTRSNAQNIIQTSHMAKSNWFSMLDIAKAAATSKIHLRALDPDFACVSFYKIFGAPTGIGALFVKRSSRHTLALKPAGSRSGYNHNRKYFGGGAVDIVLPKQDFVRSRSSSYTLDALTSGTINFRSILSLRSGLDEIQRFGMEAISMHTRSLSIEAALRLTNIQHHNGKPVVELYGQWSMLIKKMRNRLEIFNESTDELQGPIISFNVLRSDGSYVGYNEVSKLAALCSVPIQFRTGCFCNPGACQDALNLDEDKAKRNYLKNKKVCGDHIDIIGGNPTGAIRISVGKDSIWEDVDVLISFIQRTFANNRTDTSMMHAGEHSVLEGNIPNDVATNTSRLEEVYVFPIKSCAAMPVKRWRMDVNSGKLFFDREFALVDSSGTALRLCQYPKMGSIRPHIDMDRMVLDVSAPDRPKLSIDLRADGRASSIKEIKVCGNKCGGKLWGSHAVSSWFTEYLGVQCWLARSQEGKYSIPKDVGGVQNPARQSNRIGFENEAPLLLVSTNSIDRLNQVLENQSSRQVNARYFRPNLVVAMDYGGSNNNPEDQWRSIHVPHSDIELSVTGQCARCSMVDIDPDSGMKGFTLRALAEYRRNKGQITFGIFLRMAPPKNELSGNEALWIETGEVINIK